MAIRHSAVRCRKRAPASMLSLSSNRARSDILLNMEQDCIWTAYETEQLCTPLRDFKRLQETLKELSTEKGLNPCTCKI